MILLTGGNGLLGRHLKKLLPPMWTPSRKVFDITNIPDCDFSKINLIVHCAAYTDVVGAEKNKEDCYKVNVIGTRNLASLGIPMIYISTEYVFDGEKGNYSEEDYPNPKNFYSLTKMLGEYESRRTQSTVIRCLFKPRPFEHRFACIDQFTTGSYVDEISKEIALAIKNYSRLPQTLHIGFHRKTTYELARKTLRNVKPITIDEIAVKLPRDTSLNTNLWKRIKHESGFRKK